MKKTNQRTCICCRGKGDKDLFFKITKTNDNVIHTEQNPKINGRSCYVCKNKTCIELVIKRRLINKAFHQQIQDSVYQDLKKLIEVTCD